MESQRRTPLRRLLDYARPHRRAVWMSSTHSVLNKIFDLAPPVLIGMAVDIVVEGEDSFIAGFGVPNVEAQIGILAALTFAIWGLESLFEFWANVGWRNLAQTLQHELRIDAYGRIQEMELAFFEDRSTGGLMSILNDDVNQLERFLDIGAQQLLQVTTTIIVIGGMFFYIAPEVAWMSMLPMPFVLWGSVVYQKHLAPRYSSVREEVGRLNSDLAGHLGGIATIKSFTAEARERERIGSRSQAYADANRHAIRLSSAFSPLIRVLILTGFTATLVFGGLMATRGELAVGSYTVMVFLTQRLLWPLTSLGATFDLYQRAMASTTRILDLLDLTPAITDGTRALTSGDKSGALRFEAVGFHYSSGPEVLCSLDLEMGAGRTTAFVGQTGAGKSTVVKMLLRFYDPTAGRVTLNGIDLRELHVADLRGAIGLVSQDVFLFHGTVRENIAYGRVGTDSDVSDDDIVRAARIAEADDFIRKLPEGYETIVGERGQKLSGGQRQRISIARAVLKDPPILILDEATSSVDNETEAAIQRSLERLSVGRTTIVIAHRLSTIRNADRIYVLESGHVLEEGTHTELVERDGLYAGLWRVQTGEAVRYDAAASATP